MEWVVNAKTRALYPRKDMVPLVSEAGWAPGSVWTGADNLASTGIRYQGRQASSEIQYTEWKVNNDMIIIFLILSVYFLINYVQLKYVIVIVVIKQAMCYKRNIEVRSRNHCCSGKRET
jgi:hypothetical protein